MNDFSTDIEHCLKALHNGDIIVYPTDTCWGLGCDATNALAVQQLMCKSGTSSDGGFTILLASERDLLQYVASLDLSVLDFLTKASGPTTIIYENGLNVADEVLQADGSIAIRLVDEDFCRTLLKRFKKPVIFVAAAIKGQPIPKTFNQIAAEILNAADYIVQFRQNEEIVFCNSFLVKWNNGAPEYIS